MPTAQQNAQIANAVLGLRVQTAPKTLPLAATAPIFTVAGGRIQVGLLYGVVTTVIGGTTPALKLVATPTVGSANDMCLALTVTADEVGTQYTLPLSVGAALIGAVAPGKSGSAGGPGIGGQVVAPGAIGVNCSAANATGAVQWTLFWVPMDPGATVVAA